MVVLMKKVSELRIELNLVKVLRDDTTGSPVTEIGYKLFAVPEEVDMVTYQ